jgi:hypothetical protein
VQFGRPRLAALLITVLVAAALPGASVVAAADNIPPVAVDDPGTSCQPAGLFGGAYPIPEDWGAFDFAGSCSATANDTDQDGFIAAWQIVSPPSHGTLVYLRDQPGIFRYTSNADFSTPAGDYVSDSFTYQAIDDRGALSNVATMRIWVAPINDAPRFLSVPTVVVAQDSGPYSESWLPYVVAGPPNEASQSVRFITTSAETHGSSGSLFTGPVTFTDDGRLTFTPAPGQYGYALITLYLQDDGGLENYGGPVHSRPDDTSDPVTFRIDVTHPNTTPVAVDDSATFEEDGLVNSIDVLANDTDVDGDPLTVTQTTGASKGVVTIVAAGRSVTYAPNADANGSDAFTYTISDGFGGSATATVHVTINPVNDSPIASAVTVDTAYDTPVAITLSGLDLEDCELRFAIVDFPDAGTFGDAIEPACQPGQGGAPNVDTTVVPYTPHHFSGTDTFTYTVTDSAFVTSAPATVEIHVGPAPPTPTPTPTPHMAVSDIDAVVTKAAGSWTAAATVEVAVLNGGPVIGAVVVGSWTTGSTAYCQTDQSGRCSIASPEYARKAKSATFTISDVWMNPWIYEPSQNADPDGDSTGSSIVVARP